MSAILKLKQLESDYMYIPEQNFSYDYDALIKEFERDVAEFHWEPTDIIYIDRDKPIRVVGYLEYRPIVNYQHLDADETEKDLDPRANQWTKTTVSDFMREMSDMNRDI